MEAATVMPTWPTVEIVNTAGSGLTDEQGEAIAIAVAEQVLRDFGPVWHIGAHVRFVPVGRQPSAGVWTLALLGSSDQAGALGYHDLTPEGLPLGKAFTGTDLQVGASPSVTVSHELLEMLADPWINLAAQAADGRFYAWEVADAVEDDSLAYSPGGISVRVSAFVTPAWFGNGAGELTHPPGLVKGPLGLAAGGYIGVFDPGSGQGWRQVTAQMGVEFDGPTSRVDVRFADELARAVPRVGSRRERRFRGSRLWVPSTYEVA